MSYKKIKLTFGDTDDTVRRECGLVVIDVHDVDANCGSSCELRHAFVCSNYRQTIHVSDFSIKHNVGLYKSREWRLNYKGIVVIPVYYVIKQSRVGSLINICCWYLGKLKMLIKFVVIWNSKSLQRPQRSICRYCKDTYILVQYKILVCYSSCFIIIIYNILIKLLDVFFLINKNSIKLWVNKNQLTLFSSLVACKWQWSDFCSWYTWSSLRLRKWYIRGSKN